MSSVINVACPRKLPDANLGACRITLFGYKHVLDFEMQISSWGPRPGTFHEVGPCRAGKPMPVPASPPDRGGSATCMAWQANQRHAWVRGNNVYICRGKWRRLVARPGAEVAGRPAMQDVASFVPIRRGGQDMGATATDVRAARKRLPPWYAQLLADGCLPLGRCATSSRHHPGSGLVSSGAFTLSPAAYQWHRGLKKLHFISMPEKHIIQLISWCVHQPGMLF